MSLIMTRLILFVILLLLLYVMLHYFIKDIPIRKKKSNTESESEELVQDPHCQTYISKRSAVKKIISGRLVYFCNQECMKNYINEIKKKVDKAKLIRYVSG